MQLWQQQIKSEKVIEGKKEQGGGEPERGKEFISFNPPLGHGTQCGGGGFTVTLAGDCGAPVAGVAGRGCTVRAVAVVADMLD